MGRGGKLLSLFISHTGVQRAEMGSGKGGRQHMQRRQGASRAIGINLRLRLRLCLRLAVSLSVMHSSFHLA